MSDAGFDIDSAWLRRFSADAAAHFGAFAQRLREAMPGLVTVEQRRGLFGRRGDITGVAITLADKVYRLAMAQGRLTATVSMVVRGVTLNTKQLDAAAWFSQLADETRAASSDAQVLSRSLQEFMRH